MVVVEAAAFLAACVHPKARRQPFPGTSSPQVLVERGGLEVRADRMATGGTSSHYPSVWWFRGKDRSQAAQPACGTTRTPRGTPVPGSKGRARAMTRSLSKKRFSMPQVVGLLAV